MGLNRLKSMIQRQNHGPEGATVPLEISHFQAVEFNGMIYVMGALVGNWPSETPLTNILIYDPLEDIWIIGPEIPAHRQRGAAGAVAYMDKIYLVCGIVNGHTSGWVPWLDEFDPATNTWRSLPDAPRARDHIQVGIVDNQLVVAGGRRSGFQGQGFEATIAETDVYDFETGSWSTLSSPGGDIPTQRAGGTALVVDEKVVIIGGESGSQVKAHSEVEALTLSTQTWESWPNLQEGRHGTQAILSEGNLFIAAGCGNRGGSPELNSLEMYPTSMEASPGDTLQAGSLKASIEEYDFGEVRPFTTKTATIQLENTGGNQSIALAYLIAAGNDAFAIDFPFELPLMISPGESVKFDISFSPSENTTVETSVLIKTANAGRKQPLEIIVSGN